MSARTSQWILAILVVTGLFFRGEVFGAHNQADRIYTEYWHHHTLPIPMKDGPVNTGYWDQWLSDRLYDATDNIAQVYPNWSQLTDANFDYQGHYNTTHHNVLQATYDHDCYVFGSHVYQQTCPNGGPHGLVAQTHVIHQCESICGYPGYPYNPLGHENITAAHIYLDKNELWFKGAATQVPNDKYDLWSVITHELGHALGLGHLTTQQDPNECNSSNVPPHSSMCSDAYFYWESYFARDPNNTDDIASANLGYPCC